MPDVTPREVVSLLKPEPEPCPCGCGKVGRPTKKTGHPRTCVCRNKCLPGRNSRQGKAAHRKIARALGAATPGRGSSSHEESWVHPWRVEVKTGAQAGPVVTRWRLSKEQSDQSKSMGDHRPFVAIFDTRSKGDPVLAVVELEVLQAMTLIVQEVVS